MKPAKPKSPTQRSASDFARACRRLLKVFKDNVPANDGSFAYASTMRTFRRVLEGLSEAKSDPELTAAMNLSLELLRGLEGLRLAAGSHMPDDEPDDVIEALARAGDMAELLDELEAIRARQ
jgi:hypothetical protein